MYADFRFLLQIYGVAVALRRIERSSRLWRVNDKRDLEKKLEERSLDVNENIERI
jgi:hypothetical protein